MKTLNQATPRERIWVETERARPRIAAPAAAAASRAWEGPGSGRQRGPLYRCPGPWAASECQERGNSETRAWKEGLGINVEALGLIMHAKRWVTVRQGPGGREA